MRHKYKLVLVKDSDGAIRVGDSGYYIAESGGLHALGDITLHDVTLREKIREYAQVEIKDIIAEKKEPPRRLEIIVSLKVK